MKKNPRKSFMQQKNKIKTKKNITKKWRNKTEDRGHIKQNKRDDKEILKIAKDFYSDLYKKAETNE